MGRVTLALFWGALQFIVALIMRPEISILDCVKIQFANWILFGSNSSEKKFEYLGPARKIREEKKTFNTLQI